MYALDYDLKTSFNAKMGVYNIHVNKEIFFTPHPPLPYPFSAQCNVPRMLKGNNLLLLNFIAIMIEEIAKIKP